MKIRMSDNDRLLWVVFPIRALIILLHIALFAALFAGGAWLWDPQIETAKFAASVGTLVGLIAYMLNPFLHGPYSFRGCRTGSFLDY